MPDTTGHMRILKVVQSYFPFQERGGPVFKVRALATGLAKRGHQVTVLTADLGFGKGNGSQAGAERCRWGWTARNDDVEAIYLSYDRAISRGDAESGCVCVLPGFYLLLRRGAFLRAV